MFDVGRAESAIVRLLVDDLRSRGDLHGRAVGVVGVRWKRIELLEIGIVHGRAERIDHGFAADGGGVGRELEAAADAAPHVREELPRRRRGALAGRATTR